MTTEALQRAILSQPFHPFVLHLADGREVPVAHPELIAHQPGACTAVAVSSDAFEVIDLLLVVSLGPRTATGAQSP